MRAEKINLLRFINGKKQFVVPIYQRAYQWKKKDCQKLWTDLLRIAKNDNLKSYFIGSIVCLEEEGGEIFQLLIIDGQQRLATILLLLHAIGVAIENRNDSFRTSRKDIKDIKDIKDDFLFNSNKPGDLEYKLILNKSDDKETLNRLLKGVAPLDSCSQLIVDNHKFFEQEIEKQEIDLNSLYGALNKLVAIKIILDRNDGDNPQLIYESINSTGVDLSPVDLIRNYILMGLKYPDQRELYDLHWLPMERRFSDKLDTFKKFMRYYLAIKSGKTKITGTKVYDEFKCQFPDGQNIKKVVGEISRYSQYFVRMALGKEPNTTIKPLFDEIKTLNVDVSYPFLMKVYSDYEDEILNESDFIAILRLIVNYLFRRSVCSCKSASDTFSKLSKELNEENYLKSVESIILNQTGAQRFPRDDEFRREFTSRNAYEYKNRSYMLEKLENHGRKEFVNVKDYTTEHIMPQNEDLSIEWQKELGEDWRSIQKTWLHTIGNLTLTGYNSELSDKPFHEKRDMAGGFADSPFWLNRDLAKLDRWNEEEIKRRGKRLADRAIEIWELPALASEIDQEREQSTRADQRYRKFLVGEVRDLFNQLRAEILDLDPSVREKTTKTYIGYKLKTNFASVCPQKRGLKLYLDIPFGEIDDPKHMCRDVSGIGHLGTGDVEVNLSSPDQIGDVMYLVLQAFDWQSGNK